MSTELNYESVTKLSEMMMAGKLSPTELMDACLSRIKEKNSDLNIFVTLQEDSAREKAKKAEEALDQNEIWGVLHGIPIGIKDFWGYKAGMRHTYGSKLFEKFVPDNNSVFVNRLEDEGAIIVGKTNTPEFAFGSITDNILFGPTRNPFDKTRTVGGSSGGSAAAVASGMVPISQGSDMGGSIRIPASFCGVYGFKPSFGRIPIIKGVFYNRFIHSNPFMHIGPITRSVKDAALLLDVMSGPHHLDPFSIPKNSTNYLRAVDQPIKNLQIAVSPDLGIFPIKENVRQIILDSANIFSKTGANIDQIDPTFNYSRIEIQNAFFKMMVISWRNITNGLCKNSKIFSNEDCYKKLGKDMRNVVDESKINVSLDDYWEFQRIRTDMLESFQEILNDYDVIITATTAQPAFNLESPPTRIQEETIDPVRGWILTQPSNYTGYPTASIPAGFTSKHLPVGMQIIGDMFADDVVLSVSKTFEDRKPWEKTYEFID